MGVVIGRGLRRDVRRAAWRQGIRSRAAGSTRIQIDELRVVGFSASSARQIGDGMQQELIQRVGSDGVPSGWIRAGRIDAVRTNRAPVFAGMSSRAIGAAVARAVLDMPVGGQRVR